MKIHLMPDPVRCKQMTTEELRALFLVPTLFTAGQIDLVYCDADDEFRAGQCRLGHCVDRPDRQK